MWGPDGGLRKIFCILALLFTSVSVIPRSTNAQSSQQVQINDLSKRVDKLDDVTADLKALNVRVDELQEMMREMSDTQRWVTFGLLAAFAGMILNAFGVKFKGKAGV